MGPARPHRAGRRAHRRRDHRRQHAAGADDPAWAPGDAALLRAADELHADAHIGDETWAALAPTWNEAQLIELCMVVGQYHLVAFTLNSLGVQREDGVEGCPA